MFAYGAASRRPRNRHRCGPAKKKNSSLRAHYAQIRNREFSLGRPTSFEPVTAIIKGAAPGAVWYVSVCSSVVHFLYFFSLCCGVCECEYAQVLSTRRIAVGSVILRCEASTEIVVVQMTLTGHRSLVNCITMSGSLLWSGSSDGTIRAWNTAVLSLSDCSVPND